MAHGNDGVNQDIGIYRRGQLKGFGEGYHAAMFAVFKKTGINYLPELKVKKDWAKEKGLIDYIVANAVIYER